MLIASSACHNLRDTVVPSSNTLAGGVSWLSRKREGRPKEQAA
jgi:hypothetical protein